MDGILIIDKLAGFTSHDVVARCRKILQIKRIGHTGTLDPFATGVMVILVGKATRLAQFLDKDQKEYEAQIRFGFETETGDLTGEIRNTNFEPKIVSIAEIENVLKNFCGEIWQTPPMYSAKKVEGKKLYELARQGIEIERKPAKVKIYDLKITNCESPENQNNREPQTQDFGLKVVCSAGTYVRTLAQDIGKSLEAGAHLAALRRARAGKFDLSRAVTLAQLEEIVAENKLGEILISMNDALASLPEKHLSTEEILKVKNGVRINFDSFETCDNHPIRLTGADKNLLAVGIYYAAEKIIQPKIVLV